MAEQTLYIARDRKSGAHCFVRLARADELDAPVRIASPGALNELMMSRDVAGLADAAQALGPLRIRRDDLGKLVLLPSEVDGGGAAIELVDPDPTYLWQEAYFDPYSRASTTDGGFETFGRGAKAAARKAIDERSFSGHLPHGDDYVYLVEPLSDWALLRSLVSISMRLGGTYRGAAHDLVEGGEDPHDADSIRESLLEAAGFRHVTKSRSFLPAPLDAPAYVIPVAFNPFFYPGSLIKNDALFDREVIDPLLAELTESWSKALGLTHVVSLRGEKRVKLITAVQAGAAPGDLRFATTAGRDAHPVEDKWLYLAVEEGPDADETELDLANVLLRSLDALLGRPRVEYAPRESREMVARYRNLPEALWARVRNHDGYYLMTCENCHRTILATAQGAYRRFCGGSCRSIWSREQKERD